MERRARGATRSIVLPLLCAIGVGVILTGPAPHAAVAETGLARHERERARLASERLQHALNRIVVARERIQAEIAVLSDSAPASAADTGAGAARRDVQIKTREDLVALAQWALEIYGHCKRIQREAREIAAPYLPRAPEPYGVPLWAVETPEGAFSGGGGSGSVADILKAIEALTFAAEQRAQAAEVTMEQIIGAADLRRQKKGAGQGAGVWRELGPAVILGGEGYDGSRVPVSGRVTSLLVIAGGDGVVFAGTALGGVWKSGIARAAWEPLSDHEESLAIGALAFDPGTGVLYAGTGEGNVALRGLVVQGDRILAGHEGAGLLRSHDRGRTWTLIGHDVFDGAAFLELATSSAVPRLLAAATTRGLYVSRDAGDTWTRMTNGVPLESPEAIATSVWISGRNPSQAFAAFWGEGVFTTDELESDSPRWVRVLGGLPASSLSRIKIAGAGRSDRMYVLAANADHRLRGLYASSDGGKQWVRIAQAPDLLQGQGFYHMLLGVDPLDDGTVFVGGAGHRRTHASSLYRGVDAAGHWRFVPVGRELHIDFHAIAFDGSRPGRLYVANDGGVWRSDDSGRTWVSWNGGLAITQIISLDQHPSERDHVVAGTQDNGTIVYTGRPDWTHADDGDGGIVRFDRRRPSRVFSEYISFRVTRSDAGGKPGTFRPIHPVLSGVASAFLAPYDLNPEDSDEVLLGTDSMHVTYDGGNTWQTFGHALTLGKSGVRVSVVTTIRYVDRRSAYVGTSDGRVWRLHRRAGGDWDAVLIFDSGDLLGRRLYVADVAAADRADEANPNESVYVGLSEGPATLWKCAPAVRAGPRCARVGAERGFERPVYSIAAPRGGTIFVGSSDGVYAVDARDGGATRFGEGLPRTAVFHVQVHPEFALLRAGTFGRGAWETSLAGQR